MAVKQEYYTTRKDGVSLTRSYSDQGYMIKQVSTGILYSEAIDLTNKLPKYVETNTSIEDFEANLAFAQ